MNANDIFQDLSDATAGEVFQYLYEHDKPAYRACVQILASRRKLRTVILDRKSRAERHSWMRTELVRKSNGDAAIEILQAWLLGAHQALICQFLDTLKIAHNGNGLIENLPADPGDAAVAAAVERLFADHPKEAVRAYLHLFAEMDIADWPSLRKILNTDPRLCPAPTPQPA